MRKTVNVDDLRDRVNNMLAAPASSHEGRIALSVLLESVLHDTGRYRGFQFLLPNGAVDVGPEPIGPDDPRHSRRRYY